MALRRRLSPGLPLSFKDWKVLAQPKAVWKKFQTAAEKFCELTSAAWQSYPCGVRPMALRRRLSPGLPLSVVNHRHLSAERAFVRLRFCYSSLQACKPFVRCARGWEVDETQVRVFGKG